MQKNWKDFQKNILRRRNHRRDTAMSALAMVGGAAVGLTAGLLMAPDRGKTTRTRINENMRHGMDTALQKTSDTIERARMKLTHSSDQAQTALAEGRRAVTTPGTRGAAIAER